MLTAIATDRLPLATSIRLSPDTGGRQLILIKPDNRRVPFLGVTRMNVYDGLTPERIGAINRALAAEFVVILACADADMACDVYLDACDLLTSTRVAARAGRDAARREPALATGGAA